MRAFFFGCGRGVWDRDVGHFLYAPGGESLGLPRGAGMSSRGVTGIPWDRIDGQLAPREWASRSAPEEPNGVAALHHKDGWTALAFWDNTGDSRGNSNSNFFFDADLDFVGAVAAAREHFPELFERFNFEVVEVGQ